MPKTKELRQLYGGLKPKSYRLAHNHIMHTDRTGHGERGFRRFWIPPQWVGKEWKKCPCGWHNGDAHYAIAEHVDYWHEEIEKHGSLKAVYRDVDKQLAEREEERRKRWMQAKGEEYRDQMEDIVKSQRH
jgi:hypothetical protein